MKSNEKHTKKNEAERLITKDQKEKGKSRRNFPLI